MDRIVDELPPYYTLSGEWKIGNFAYRSKKESILDSSTCFVWKNDYNTPSSHFRRYIKHVHLSRKNPPDYISYPYYAKPCKLPYGVYLDISHAYQQIGRVLGAEIHWKENRWMEFGMTRFDDELFDVKVMRGLIVSATGEKGSVTTWNSKQDTIVSHSFQNEYFAPHLRLGVLRILHAVCASVLPYIVYWHTDGMIVPLHFLSKVETILSSWGLESKVKSSGLTIVKARGVYSIGSEKTSQFHRFKTQSASYINTRNMKWFQSQFVTGLSLIDDLNHSELL